MADAPTPLFVTVLDIDTLTPVDILDGALRLLTVRSTPLDTVIAVVEAALFVSLLSVFVLVASAIAPM